MKHSPLGAVALVAQVALASVLPATSGAASDEKPSIALSNASMNSAWRRIMVDIFDRSAAQAQSDGIISSYSVVNADGTANQQNAQLAQLILQRPDAILIDAASPTANNGMVRRACEAGILVISFDNIVTEPCAYQINFDWSGYGKGAAFLANALGGEGNILVIRGQAGAFADEEIHGQQMAALKEFPGIKIVAEVNGDWSPTVAQTAVGSILPNLPRIDGILTQGGSDGYGAIRALEAYGKDYADGMPVVTGNGDYEFIKWWLEKNESTGYETISVQNNPGISSAALWYAVEILAGAADAEKNVLLPMTAIQEDEARQVFGGMSAGEQYSAPYTQDWIEDEFFKQ